MAIKAFSFCFAKLNVTSITCLKTRSSVYPLLCLPGLMKSARLISNQINSRPKGLVLILGWTGSKEKNLRKYTDFYEDRGFETIKYCPPASLVFGMNPKKQLLGHSPQIIEKLLTSKRKGLPLYFHSLSNGGVYMYYTLLKEIQDSGLRGLKIGGTIFDSAPSPTDIGVVSGAAFSSCNGSLAKRITVGSLTTLWVYFCLGFNTAKAKLKGLPVDIERYRFYVAEQLVEMPNMGPQHFLFSKIDSVIPDNGIEWFMDERRKKGVQVSFKKWNDSHHVKHVVQYPEEYISSLDKFLGTCKNNSYEICANHKESAPVSNQLAESLSLFINPADTNQ